MRSGSAAWLLVASLSLASAVCPRTAWADQSSEDRQTALKLAGEALDLFAAADYRAALDKFVRADEILPAPTLKLHVARCLDKLDRMKEAADKYREVIATELEASAPAVHREARQKAVPELAAVLDSMPSVRVTVKGPGAADAELEMDGKRMNLAQVGEKMSLNPGHYRFDAKVGDRTVTREIDLERGHNERLVLHLPIDDPLDAPSAEGQDDGLAWQVGGWAAIGVGVAGVAVGTILGVMVLSEEKDLEARCPNRQCPTSVHDDAKSFDDKRIGSTVGFIVGGVGLAAGVTLLLLAPSSAPDAALVRPLVGPGFVGVEGAF